MEVPMAFRIRGLSPDPFRRLCGLSAAALAAEGVVGHHVAPGAGAPDRVSMRDLAPGESALLLNYEHLPVDSPYRSRHAIFVAEGAETRYDARDEVPEVMTRRIIALRGIDGRGHIVTADLAEGAAIAPAIRKMLAQEEVAYIHSHYAKYGCFAARIDRG